MIKCIIAGGFLMLVGPDSNLIIPNEIGTEIRFIEARDGETRVHYGTGNPHRRRFTVPFPHDEVQKALVNCRIS